MIVSNLMMKVLLLVLGVATVHTSFALSQVVVQPTRFDPPESNKDQLLLNINAIPQHLGKSNPQSKTKEIIPGSFHIPLNRWLLRKIIKSYKEVVRPLLSLSFWGYVIVARKSFFEVCKNIITWSFYASATLNIAIRVLARLVLILHVYDPSSCDEAAKTNATENKGYAQALDQPLYGLNVPMKKFHAWIGYCLGNDGNCVQPNAIETRLYFFWKRRALQAIWQEGLLLRGTEDSSTVRGGLVSGCNIYISLLEDELEDDHDHSKLIAFLHTEYGPNITRLEATNWNQESDDTQLEVSRLRFHKRGTDVELGIASLTLLT
jgi:hypothetical protein